MYSAKVISQQLITIAVCIIFMRWPCLLIQGNRM